MRVKLFIALACLFLVLAHTSAHAQISKPLEFTTVVSAKVERAVYQKLKGKIDPFYEEYNYMPYLHYAFADVNRDGKNEIFIRFAEEYEFVDRRNNKDVHIFAQTSRGLIEILYAQGTSINIGAEDHTGLNQIYVYKGPRGNRFETYRWDGKKEYVKK